MEKGLCQRCPFLPTVPCPGVIPLPRARCHQWVPLLWLGARAATGKRPPPPSQSSGVPVPCPGRACLQLCCSLLPPAPPRVLIGFLELYMGLLLSLYILFWALAWGHLFSVSMWRVSRSPVLL